MEHCSLTHSLFPLFTLLRRERDYYLHNESCFESVAGHVCSWSHGTIKASHKHQETFTLTPSTSLCCSVTLSLWYIGLEIVRNLTLLVSISLNGSLKLFLCFILISSFYKLSTLCFIMCFKNLLYKQVWIEFIILVLLRNNKLNKNKTLW